MCKYSLPGLSERRSLDQPWVKDAEPGDISSRCGITAFWKTEEELVAATGMAAARCLRLPRCIPPSISKLVAWREHPLAGTLAADRATAGHSPPTPMEGLPARTNVYVADGSNWRFGCPLRRLTLNGSGAGQRTAHSRRSPAGSCRRGRNAAVTRNGQRVLVSGAAGFLGRRCCAALSAAGFEVAALVRNPAAAADLGAIAAGGIFRAGTSRRGG